MSSEFIDIHVKTLHHQFKLLVLQHAADAVLHRDGKITKEGIEQLVPSILTTGDVEVAESVTLSNLHAWVVLDVPSLVPSAMARAVRMVSIAYEKLGGNRGTYVFSPNMRLVCTPTEVTSLLH